jgi:hypothetical protein
MLPGYNHPNMPDSKSQIIRPGLLSNGTILPIFDTQESTSDRSIYVVEAKSNPKHDPLTKSTVALFRDQYKMILYFGYDGIESEYELFNLEKDPEELKNLYSVEKTVAATMGNELIAKLDEVNQRYK